MIEQRNEPAYCYQIDRDSPSDELPWYTDMLLYVEHRTYPEYASANDLSTNRKLAIQYVVCGGTLLLVLTFK